MAIGVRVRFSGRPGVIDGYFAETKELIAGFWLWEVASLAQVRPVGQTLPQPCARLEIEIRQVFEAEDFGANS